MEVKFGVFLTPAIVGMSAQLQAPATLTMVQNTPFD